MSRQNQARPAIQPKMAAALQQPKRTVAPPAYRPQPVPKVLQKKSVTTQQPRASKVPCAPVAPPVYSPQQPPCILRQMRQTVDQKHAAVGPPRHPVAPSRTQIKNPAMQMKPSPNGLDRSVATPATAARPQTPSRQQLPPIARHQHGARVSQLNNAMQVPVRPTQLIDNVKPHMPVNRRTNGSVAQALMRQPPPSPPPSAHSHSTHCIQMVGKPLTLSKADPAREDQATNLKVSLDGAYYGDFKSGKWKNNELAWQKSFEALGFQYSGNKPHAEEKFIGWLYHAGPKIVNYVSLSMDRSPCNKCAEKLVALKLKHGLTIRIKATRVNTEEQFKGLELLKDGGISFQFLAGKRLNKKYEELESVWDSRIQSETKSQARYEKTINNYRSNVDENVERAMQIYGQDITLSWKDQKKSWKGISNVTPFNIYV